MAAGCNERIDLEFLLWVWNYPRRGRKRLMAETQKFSDKKFVILSSSAEIDFFLERVKN